MRTPSLAPVVFAAGIIGSGVVHAESKSQTDPLDVLQPLIGHWVADPDPHSPGVTGWCTFQRDLQNRVVVRRNRAEYPAAKDRPASTHDDLMVVYAENGRVRADYFDNEGHVIRYEVQAQAPTRLVFTSDAQPGAPRFRLTYAWPPAGGGLDLSFEIASPSAPDQFKPYISARLHREKEK